MAPKALKPNHLPHKFDFLQGIAKANRMLCYWQQLLCGEQTEEHTSSHKRRSVQSRFYWNEVAMGCVRAMPCRFKAGRDDSEFAKGYLKSGTTIRRAHPGDYFEIDWESLVNCLWNVVIGTLVDCEGPFWYSPTPNKQFKRPLRVNSWDKPAS